MLSALVLLQLQEDALDDFRLEGLRPGCPRTTTGCRSFSQAASHIRQIMITTTIRKAFKVMQIAYVCSQGRRFSPGMTQCTQIQANFFNHVLLDEGPPLRPCKERGIVHWITGALVLLGVPGLLLPSRTSLGEILPPLPRSKARFASSKALHH